MNTNTTSDNHPANEKALAEFPNEPAIRTDAEGSKTPQGSFQLPPCWRGSLADIDLSSPLPGGYQARISRPGEYVELAVDVFESGKSRAAFSVFYGAENGTAEKGIILPCESTFASGSFIWGLFRKLEDGLNTVRSTCTDQMVDDLKMTIMAVLQMHLAVDPNVEKPSTSAE